MRRVVALVVLVVLAGAGCSDDDALPEPDSTTVAPEPTVACEASTEPTASVEDCFLAFVATTVESKVVQDFFATDSDLVLDEGRTWCERIELLEGAGGDLVPQIVAGLASREAAWAQMQTESGEPVAPEVAAWASEAALTAATTELCPRPGLMDQVTAAG
jgi:hypothetical protein